MPDSKPQALFRVNLAQRLLSPSGSVRRNPYLGHALALFSFLAALALRFVLDPVLPPGFPFITFFPAVLLTAFLAGWRPATVCALLSGFSSWYWFLGAPGSFTLNLGTALAMGFFDVIALVQIFVIEAVARSNDRLALREAQLETIVETVPVGLVMAEFPSGRIVGGNRYVEQLVRHPVIMSPDIHSYDEWVSFHADGSRVSGHEYPLARMMLAGEENPSVEVQYQRGTAHVPGC